MAKAEDEKRKLHEEVLERYDTVERMGTYAQSDGPGGKKAAELRTRYNRAKNELKLAKEELARLRDCRPEPRDREDGLGGITDGVQLPPADASTQEELDHGGLSGRKPDSDAVIDCEGGKMDYKKLVNDSSPSAEKSRKKKVQQDLEGRKAVWPLTGKIKVPDPRFELENPSWKLKGNVVTVSTLVEMGNRLEVQKIVQKGLRINDDRVHPDSEFDEEVERFTDEIMRGIIHRLPEDE
ncbi:MAG: hypothetical protein LLG45_13190 [Actinomycetia bacterium]|nr:hypothetical protein [Actinomycetes bacterium]